MKTFIAAGWIVAIITLLAGPADAGEELVSQTGRVLPEAKQTSLGLYVTSVEAHQKWEASSGTVKILDVRTLEEHIFIGHPDMAWNIPFALQTHEWDDEKQRFTMELNPDFVSQVRALADPNDTILIMCRSGGRSAMAVNALAEVGFTYVYTIIDGMEGDKVDDPESIFHGKRMKNGWKNSGLPWTYDLDPERIRIPHLAEVSEEQ